MKNNSLIFENSFQPSLCEFISYANITQPLAHLKGYPQTGSANVEFGPSPPRISGNSGSRIAGAGSESGRLIIVCQQARIAGIKERLV